MSLLTDFYPEARFGGFTDVDGTLAFYRRVRALLEPGEVVIDFGCGRGAWLEDPILVRRYARLLRGRAGKVIGLDADPRAASNSSLDEFHLLDVPGWPLADASAGLVVCDNVLEHLAEPSAFFSEAWRVLQPGGRLCIRTPNKWGYAAVLSRLIPNRSHAGLLGHIKDGCHEQDVFQVYYRCSTLPELRRALRSHGFEGVVYGYEAEPSYLSFSRLAYTLGVFHQRHAPGWLKLALFCFARKPA